jgi:hypothetical protein
MKPGKAEGISDLEIILLGFSQENYFVKELIPAKHGDPKGACSFMRGLPPGNIFVVFTRLKYKNRCFSGLMNLDGKLPGTVEGSPGNRGLTQY